MGFREIKKVCSRNAPPHTKRPKSDPPAHTNPFPDPTQIPYKMVENRGLSCVFANELQVARVIRVEESGGRPAGGGLLGPWRNFFFHQVRTDIWTHSDGAWRDCWDGLGTAVRARRVHCRGWTCPAALPTLESWCRVAAPRRL